MSYNIYPIFFYVDPPSGGGGGADPSITPPSVSEDIGNGGYEETNGSGNGTITDNGNDITTEIGIMNEFRQSQGYSKDAKMIKSFSINNFSTVRNFLDPNGDRRNIIINGDVGAVFTLTIKDSSGCSMLDEDLEWISIPKTGTYIHTQHFPSIVKSADGGIMEEYYDVDLVKADLKAANYDDEYIADTLNKAFGTQGQETLFDSLTKSLKSTNMTDMLKGDDAKALEALLISLGFLGGKY